MRWTREQYLAYMTFEQVDQPMLVELFGLLIGLEAEWRAQGATDDEIDLTRFAFDYVDHVSAGGNCRAMGGVEPVIIEDTDTHRLERDHFGRLKKLDTRTATIALPIEFPVKNMDDWLKLKPMFQWNDERIDWDAVEHARQAQRQGALVVASIPGAFDTVRDLMGEEMACLAYYDQPELMADILETLRNTATNVLARISERVTIDQLSMHEDLAGRSGPLIGPRQVEEWFQPYYRACWDIVQSRGGRLFQIDTDGNIWSILDALLACGVNSVVPMEPAAGMDIVEVRRRYGKRLAFLGGIDKFAVIKGPEAIEQELRRKLDPEVWRIGGAVYSLDHRIPNGTPLEHYRYYVRRAREILGLPPFDTGERFWMRMAF